MQHIIMHQQMSSSISGLLFYQQLQMKWPLLLHVFSLQLYFCIIFEILSENIKHSRASLGSKFWPENSFPVLVTKFNYTDHKFSQSKLGGTNIKNNY